MYVSRGDLTQSYTNTLREPRGGDECSERERQAWTCTQCVTGQYGMDLFITGMKAGGEPWRQH